MRIADLLNRSDSSALPSGEYNSTLVNNVFPLFRSKSLSQYACSACFFKRRGTSRRGVVRKISATYTRVPTRVHIRAFCSPRCVGVVSGSKEKDLTHNRNM